MSSITGDWSDLTRLIASLDRAATGELAKKVSHNLAEEAISLVHEGFAGSHDPYGKDWDKLQLRVGRPLQDTGPLESSFHVMSWDGSGFRIGSSMHYAPTHQFGAVIVPVKAKMLHWKVGGQSYFAKKVTIPARPMLPRENTLPPAWADAFVETADEVLTAHFQPEKK